MDLEPIAEREPEEPKPVMSEQEIFELLNGPAAKPETGALDSQAPSEGEDGGTPTASEEPELTLVVNVASLDPKVLEAVTPVSALAALALPVSRDATTLTLWVAEPVDQPALDKIAAESGLTLKVEPKPMLEMIPLLRQAYGNT
jgi:hypothetical protein